MYINIYVYYKLYYNIYYKYNNSDQIKKYHYYK